MAPRAEKQNSPASAFGSKPQDNAGADQSGMLPCVTLPDDQAAAQNSTGRDETGHERRLKRWIG